MGTLDGKKWWNCPKLAHFSPISLLFPIDFTHFLYISQNVLLANSHNAPFSSIFPHVPPFPPSFPHFPAFSPILPLIPFSQAPGAGRLTQKPAVAPNINEPAQRCWVGTKTSAGGGGAA